MVTVVAEGDSVGVVAPESPEPTPAGPVGPRLAEPAVPAGEPAASVLPTAVPVPAPTDPSPPRPEQPKPRHPLRIRAKPKPAVAPSPAEVPGGAGVRVDGDAAGARPAGAHGPAPRPDHDALAAYLAGLRTYLQHSLVYPRRAQKLRLSGKPVVRFRVLPDGALDAASLHVAESSGIGLLDTGALDTVRAAAPFPAPPGGQGLEVRLPVAFALEN